MPRRCRNCTDPARGYVDGGIDTLTAEKLIAAGCGVTLPRVENNRYLSLLDECGGHTQDYHFHERLSCLYDMTSPGHSSKVGVGREGTALYGKWEDYASGELPQLDVRTPGLANLTNRQPSSRQPALKHADTTAQK